MRGPARIATLGTATGLLGFVLSLFPVILEVEETVGLAWLFAARGAIDAPEEVAIVSLAGDSADAFGVSRDVDEWPRALHGVLIDKLAAAGAAVIAFDVIFEAPREAEPDGDARLAEAIERAGNVILAERVREVPHDFAIGEQRLRPIEPFRRGALATAPFVLPLVPARVSQSWTFGRAEDTPSLPATALHAYALQVHEELAATIAEVRPDLAISLPLIDTSAIREHGLQEVMRRLRGLFQADPSLAKELTIARRRADDGDGAEKLRALIELYSGGDSRYLNFYGPARTVATSPLHEVLDADEAALHKAFSGRAVFVGFSENRRSEQQDYFPSVFSERSGQRLSGVEIGATAFANLLRSESVRPLPLPLHWTIVAAWGLLVASSSLRLRGFVALAAVLILGGLFAAASHYAFRAQALWLPLVVPLGVQLPFALLAGLSWNYAILRKQRERIHAALGYYLPAGVVDRLAEATAPQSSRELVFGTCLVTDAEQYTTLSESLHPAELGDLMDAYYDVLVGAVHRHGGVVSDIGGDSMVAVWPAASEIGSTRVAACRAALDVLADVEAFNRERVRRELPTRIGIDSGQLLLGNVGASARGEYRAVGDIVNTAARLQGLNRLLGTRVLVSAGVVDSAPGILCRPFGEFLLVGKKTPVSVFEVQQATGDPDPAVLELDEAFAAALERFKRGDWRAAEAAFAKITERFPQDRASRFFAAQCRELGSRPAREWDGIVRVTVK